MPVGVYIFKAEAVWDKHTARWLGPHSPFVVSPRGRSAGRHWD